MNMTVPPNLSHCLAYVAVSNYQTWLGRPSPRDLEWLMAGAAMRAQLLGVEIPEWRVFGNLERPEFYRPLVARTGDPMLSVKWAIALELIHFNLEAAMAELQTALEQWQQANYPLSDLAYLNLWPSQNGLDLNSLLRSLARRPGMYLGINSGWGLRCYLHGMHRGGDWLGLPTLSGLTEIIQAIEDRSVFHYGSPFAAYRVYPQDVQSLLGWAGIEPEDVVE
jgi:hypothetical protein